MDRKPRKVSRMSQLYKPAWNEQVRKLCAKGFTRPEVADFLGINVRTLDECRALHPEFDAAMALGKDSADDRVEQSLYMRATGFTYVEEQLIVVAGKLRRETVTKYVIPDTKACATWLGARRRQEWSQRLELTGEEGKPLAPYDGNEFARRVAFALDPRFAGSVRKQQH